jgi:hypothetical protein
VQQKNVQLKQKNVLLEKNLSTQEKQFTEVKSFQNQQNFLEKQQKEQCIDQLTQKIQEKDILWSNVQKENKKLKDKNHLLTQQMELLTQQMDDLHACIKIKQVMFDDQQRQLDLFHQDIQQKEEDTFCLQKEIQDLEKALDFALTKNQEQKEKQEEQLLLMEKLQQQVDFKEKIIEKNKKEIQFLYEKDNVSTHKIDELTKSLQEIQSSLQQECNQKDQAFHTRIEIEKKKQLAFEMQLVTQNKKIQTQEKEIRILLTQVSAVTT